MGNLHEQTWEDIWTSDQAKKVREQVKNCQRECWMIGSASPAMKQRIWVPGWWIIKHKLFMGNRYSLDENEFMKQENKMRKVLFFTHSLVGGGAEKTIITLSEYINKNYCDVEAHIA